MHTAHACAAIPFCQTPVRRARDVTPGAPRVFTWRDRGAANPNSAEDVQQTLLVPKPPFDTTMWGGQSEDTKGDAEAIVSPDFGVMPPTGKGIVTQRWVNFGDYIPTVPLCSDRYLHTGSGGFYLNKRNGESHTRATVNHQDCAPHPAAPRRSPESRAELSCVSRAQSRRIPTATQSPTGTTRRHIGLRWPTPWPASEHA